VATWQLAVLAVLATGFRVSPGTVTVMALAGLLVAATSVRVGGLCGYQWVVVLARYVLRRRRTAARTPVRAVAPKLAVHQHEDRVGNRTGIATLDGDHVAVVRLVPATHPDPRLLVSLLHKAIDRDDYPISGARLVVLAVPASPWPARMYWLALRYRAADAPWAALARGGGVAGCRKAVASAAQRLVSDLAGAGCAGTALDAPELSSELLVALGVSHGARAEESWRHWSAGSVRQACFTPRSPADAFPLLGRCVPDATFTCTAYSVTRAIPGGPPRVTATIRLGVLGKQFWLTPERVAGKLGVRLLPANGRQVDGVLATLPLA
jgi:type VII secretion protein EccE